MESLLTNDRIKHILTIAYGAALVVQNGEAAEVTIQCEMTMGTVTVTARRKSP